MCRVSNELLPSDFEKMPNSKCDMQCEKDEAIMCGGDLLFSAYSLYTQPFSSMAYTKRRRQDILKDLSEALD